MTPRSKFLDGDNLVAHIHRLEALTGAVERQIGIVADAAEEMGIDPFVMRDTHGNWPMVQLLTAQANTQLALTLLLKEKKKV